jgi:hypothetical protein
MRPLARILFLCVVSLAAGCTTYRTTDGFEFSSITGKDQVLRTLGAPDMIDEHEHYGFGHYHSVTYTYLHRGYRVGFRDGLVRSVTQIADADRAEVERRVRAFKEEVPKIKIDEPAASVIAHLGPPDFVDIVYTEDGIRHAAYAGPYQGQLESSPPPETVFAFWKTRGLLVTFERGRAAKAEPMADRHWRNVLHESPPKA